MLSNFFIVQIVCDAQLLIKDMEAHSPGSCHDAFIWQQSMLQEHFQRGDYCGRWLLGDSGYPATDWEGGERATTSHTGPPGVVEQCNRVLKSRFRYSERFVCIIQMNGQNRPINEVEVQITPTMAAFGIAMHPSFLEAN